MHTKHAETGRMRRSLPILLLIVASTMLLAAPAHAAPQIQARHATADTLSLSIDDGTTFTYAGSPQPTFTAVVVFTTKPTSNYFWSVSGYLEDGEGCGSNTSTSSQDGLTATFTHFGCGSGPIKPGQHTAVATFLDPNTNTTLTSNPVSFTVNKADANLYCGIDGNAYRFEGAGKTLHISMVPTARTAEQVPVDWQDGTYTVTFDGPTHLAYPNLIPDSNDGVTVTAPSQIGNYQLACAFSGTPLFTPTDSPPITYTFSALQPLGSVQLFTNPTTLAAKQNLTFYFVFHAAPGLPTPTGEFSIYFGQYFLPINVKLDSDGTCLVRISPLPALYGISKISIQYYGDVEYNAAWVYFPLTNPPIPNSDGSGGPGGSGGGSGGGNAQATPTTGGTANAQGTATPTAGAAPTAAGPGALVASASSLSDNNGWLVLITIVVLLIVLGLGAIAVVLYMKRRGKRSSGAGDQMASIPLAQSPASSDEETIPVMHGDRFPSP